MCILMIHVNVQECRTSKEHCYRADLDRPTFFKPRAAVSYSKICRHGVFYRNPIFLFFNQLPTPKKTQQIVLCLLSERWLWGNFFIRKVVSSYMSKRYCIPLSTHLNILNVSNFVWQSIAYNVLKHLHACAFKIWSITVC